MVNFYKIVDRNTNSDVYDLSVSNFYSDLSEGKADNITIRGGMVQDIGIFDFPIPLAPSFGDATLSGLQFRFNMNDAAVDGSVTGPLDYVHRFGVYKMKENTPLGDEEGVMERVSDTANNVMAPAAVFTVHAYDSGNDPKYTLMEDFSNATETEIVKHNIKYSGAYLDLHFAWTEWETTFQNVGGYFGTVGNESDFGKWVGISNPVTGEIIVPVEKDGDRWFSTAGGTAGGRHNTGDTSFGGRSATYHDRAEFYDKGSAWNRHWGENGVGDKVKWLYNVQSIETEFKPITSDSTIFDKIITGSPNVLKASAMQTDAVSSGDGGASSYAWGLTSEQTPYHVYSNITFSSEGSSSQCMLMEQYWDYDGAQVMNAQKTFAFSNGRARQSMCLLRKNMSLPVKFLEMGSAVSSVPKMLYEIDIDIMFDEMGPVFKFAPDASTFTTDFIYTHLRSFAIIFGQNVPDDNMDMVDYISTHCLNTSFNGDLDHDFGHADVDKNLWGVIFYLVPPAWTANPPASGDAVPSVTGNNIPRMKAVCLGDVDGTNLTRYDALVDGAGSVYGDIDGVIGWKNSTGSVAPTWGLELQKWYRLKFTYDINGGNGKITDNNGFGGTHNAAMEMFVLETDGTIAQSFNAASSGINEFISPLYLRNCNLNMGASISHMNVATNWAPHMSLWMNNISFRNTEVAGGSSGVGLGEQDQMFGTKNGYSADKRYSRNRVFIDKIAFRNNNLVHNNLGSENNRTYSTTSGVVTSNNQTLRYPANLNHATVEAYAVPPTGIALGFNDRAQLNGVTKFLLFSGFKTADPTYAGGGVNNLNTKAGYISNLIPELCGDTSDMFNNDSTDVLDLLSAGLTGTQVITGDGVGTPLQDVDGFSQKGLVKVSGVVWDDDDDRRECSWVAAKILRVISTSGYAAKFTVDDTSVFDVPLGTQFCIYAAGEEYNSGSPSAHAIVGLQSVTDNVVTISHYSGAPLSALLRDDTSGSVVCKAFISPYLFWLLIQLDGADDGVVEYRYSSVCLLPTLTATTGGALGLGATYNEFSFATNSGDTKYHNKRSMVIGPDAAYETSLDYGWGTFEDNATGYIDSFIPTLGENIVDLTRAMENHNFEEEGSRFSFCIMPAQEVGASECRLIMHSSDQTDDINKRPKLYGVFKDELPERPELSVIPNEDRPFYPEFTWDASDDDLWYGFLKITDRNIYNQYQDAVLYYPLNEAGLHGTVAAAPIENISGMTTAISGTASEIPLYDAEGLAGNCLRFDGGDSYIVVNDASASDPTVTCTTEMSIVAHIIPEPASDVRYIIAQYETASNEKFFLALNGSNNITARVFYDASSNYVSLKSSSIVVADGETPTNIILTVDTKAREGNVKLFINGKLEDMTGRALTVGTVNNWKKGANINGGNSEIIIGNLTKAGSFSFEGRMEEIVIYDKLIYPVVPTDGKYTLTKPLTEISAADYASSKSYVAKLFVKDYHNIRGKIITEVASSPPVTFRKAGFILDTS